MSNTSGRPALPLTDARELQARVDGAADRPSERHSPVAAAATRPLAMAVADLDRFGEVNTRLGMEAGDRVLATFERTLTGSLPADDAVVARIGGDEYAIALLGTSAESALIQLEEVRSHYAAHGVQGIDEALDASFGIAARPPHAEDIDDV